ncbi:uncharacterized protein LOC110113935 isoform X1 [Dendrobium catenatum]|uniref:uncharacterized protein LOC110113935 isoform X1 n=2 Tax=Dendrobium catenatum TaxID=906689 RepID=UPI0009F66F83|nr:uncharacterized protein LOC110113935 isoform X1 [Dendrobium catenatum]
MAQYYLYMGPFPTLLCHPFLLSSFSSELSLTVERMAPLPFSNPPELVGRRLYELLEQPQEPFLMEVYLLENGCSGRIVRSPSSPSCWPLNAAGKRLRKFGSHGGIRRSRVAGFLRRVIVNLVYCKALRKALHLDRKTAANKRSNIFDFFLVELQHSDESYPSGKQNECPLPSSSINLKETREKSLCQKKVNFSNSRRLLFDCLSDSEGRIWNFHGCLNSELFEESMNELIFSWEREKGDVTSLTQIVVSEFARLREKRNQLKPEAREIGLSLEAAIFDDLMEETIMDMMNSNFHT